MYEQAREIGDFGIKIAVRGETALQTYEHVLEALKDFYKECKFYGKPIDIADIASPNLENLASGAGKLHKIAKHELYTIVDEEEQERDCGNVVFTYNKTTRKKPDHNVDYAARGNTGYRADGYWETICLWFNTKAPYSAEDWNTGHDHLDKKQLAAETDDERTARISMERDAFLTYLKQR
jgi:hypothetical protein